MKETSLFYTLIGTVILLAFLIVGATTGIAVTKSHNRVRAERTRVCQGLPPELRTGCLAVAK